MNKNQKQSTHRESQKTEKESGQGVQKTGRDQPSKERNPQSRTDLSDSPAQLRPSSNSQSTK